MTENLNMAGSILRMLKLRLQCVSTKDGGKSLNFSLGDVSSCESCLCKGNFDELNLLLLCFLRKKYKASNEHIKPKKKSPMGDKEKRVGKIDRRPMCRYGTDCYRKNPVHFKEYRHPGKFT